MRCRQEFLNDRKTITRQVLTSSSPREEIILVLKSIHHDLMKCVRLVNIIFGFQTMLCLGITFLFTLFTFFVSFKAFYYHDVEIGISLTSIYWCIFYNYFEFFIVWACNLVDRELAQLSTLIYKMMNRNVCSTLTMESFGNQVKQISGKSSCGLFNFDYQVIMMVSLLNLLFRNQLFGQFSRAQSDVFIDFNIFHNSGAI